MFAIDLTLIGILGVVVMVLFIFLGMNMGMSMFVVGLIGYALVTDFSVAMGIFRTVPFSNSTNYSLAVIPLFICMGMFALVSGMGQGLYECANKWFSGVKGGLAIANILACTGFGAICGSIAATVATMAKLSLPEMKRYGYADSLSTASVAAGGSASFMVPPSTGFILYAIIAEQSVGRLFASGILPALMLAAAYSITVMILCKRNPGLAPAGEKYSMSEKVRSLPKVLPIVVVFATVIGGMFTGVFTANEASAVGAALTILYTVFAKRFTFKVFFDAIFSTVKSTAMIFQIMLGAYTFGYFLNITGLPQKLAMTIAELEVNRYVVMILLIAVYIFVGMIMDEFAIILVTVPIFLPVALSLDFDPIWFGVIIVLMMCCGSIAPPIGLNLFIIAGIVKDVPLTVMFRGIIPFVFAIIAVTMVILFVPQIPMILPNLIFGTA